MLPFLSLTTLCILGLARVFYFYHKTYTIDVERRILNLVSGLRRAIENRQLSPGDPVWLPGISILEEDRENSPLYYHGTCQFPACHWYFRYLPPVKQYCLFQVIHPQLLELCERISISVDAWGYQLQNTNSLILILSLRDYWTMALCLSLPFILDFTNLYYPSYKGYKKLRDN